MKPGQGNLPLAILVWAGSLNPCAHSAWHTAGKSSVNADCAYEDEPLVLGQAEFPGQLMAPPKEAAV